MAELFVNISVQNEDICIRFGTLIDFGYAKVSVGKVYNFVDHSGDKKQRSAFSAIAELLLDVQAFAWKANAIVFRLSSVCDAVALWSPWTSMDVNVS